MADDPITPTPVPTPAPAADPPVAPAPVPAVTLPVAPAPTPAAPVQPIIVNVPGQPAPPAPVEPATPPAPAPTPEPEPPAKPIEQYTAEEMEQLKNQANFFIRNPDKLEVVADMIEADGGTKPVRENTERLNRLEIEIAKRDAIIKHGLSETDMQFVHGNTPEEIATSAVNVKAYKDGMATPADPNAPPPAPGTPPATPGTPPIPELPTYDNPSEVMTEAEAKKGLREATIAAKDKYTQ